MAPEDIVALVWKRGWSLRQLGADAGVTGSTVSYALRKPNPTGEKILIEFLGLSGHELWPDRYAPDGTRIVPDRRAPRRGQISRGEAA